MQRIDSIDFTRGIVMIIMALDHVRDLLHENALTESPTNLDTTTPILFFTRWITYLCAPIFVFLAGTSSYISFKKSSSIVPFKSFLLKRGLYLILLEFAIVNFLLFFDVGFHTLIFEVIAAIGVGFVVLSFLLGLHIKSIGLLGLSILFFHNILPMIPFEQDSIVKGILSPLFSLNVFPFLTNRVFIIAYPPIPWLGIMLVGFASGKFFELPVSERKHLFLKIGCGAVLLFTGLRVINIYGDPVLWSTQKNTLYTFLSFMNVTKYPPSLLFCSITLGIMFLLLAAAEQAKGWIIKVPSVFGKVPLFYFLAHFFIIHVTLIVILFMQGFQWSQLEFASGTMGRPKNEESGVPLWAVYFIWVIVVLLLYKPCLWFGQYKINYKYWWLRYI